jgi:hypothetical protein
MAIIGALSIVLIAGITAVVLHDHDLRSGCFDDLDSVVDEMKVVVRENGDLDCVRKSPEEREGSKASQLVKNLQHNALDVEALRNLLAIATAAKNGSESIDLTDDSNDDPPRQRKSQGRSQGGGRAAPSFPGSACERRSPRRRSPRPDRR